MAATALPDSSEVGMLGVRHLKRLWAAGRDRDRAAPSEERLAEADLDLTLLAGLHLNIRETLTYLGRDQPELDAFESWVLAQNDGVIAPWRIQRINAAVAGDFAAVGVPPDVTGWEDEPGLTEEELQFWDENGYVIVRSAVTREQARAAEAAIWSFLGMDRDDPESWYGKPFGHSIWVPLLRHPAFRATRNAARVYRAFAQVWGRDDLWATVDQGGMNPPERPGWPFPGPHIHWDTSIALPLNYDVQGILYLTGTAPDQGAFSCIPGFHREIEGWLRDLPDGADPHTEIRKDPRLTPIAASAGDLILWNALLPHGSSPNRAARPRMVQYLSLRPSRYTRNPVWR